MEFLKRLRTANLERLPKFGHGGHGELGSWSPMKWGCAIAGEVGELCNMLKKYERQLPRDPSRDELHTEIQDEIADVLIYLDLLASLFDVDLQHAAELKFNRTSRVHGLSDRL